jgi:hypothetical protein
VKQATLSTTDGVATLPQRSSLRSLVRSPLMVAAGTLILLLAVSAVLRTRSISSPFWIDEGVSVGIASHSLTGIPGLLRQDGSPPLYYLMLHEWIRVFGSSVAATHALSVLFALLAIPAGLWAGWSLFGRRVGFVCAALLAFNPLLSAYAQETRMYSFVAILGLLTAAAFVQVFILRRRAYLALLVPSMTAMLYTHNWAAFLCAGAFVALIPVLRVTGDRRGVLVDAVIGFGGTLLLYAPWIPSVLFQAHHTGAPWASHPKAAALTHAAYFVVGSAQIGTAILLAGGVGIVAIVRRRASSAESVAAISLLTMAFAALMFAWLYSQASLAWAPRYLTILIGPLVLVSALGLTRAGTLGAIVTAMVIWLSIGLTGPYVQENKSNVDKIAQRIGDRIRPGELVVSTQPEQVPVLHYYLPAGLRYATPMGPVPDPTVMDWRDAVVRLRASHTPTQLSPLIRALRPGERLLLVSPVTRKSGWKTRWTKLVKRRARQWEHVLAGDHRLYPIKKVRFHKRSRFSTLKAVLYVRRH